jgi:hypothetical protein
VDKVSINKDQCLYVIPCGNGYTCLGFDVCLTWQKAIGQWLRDNWEITPYLPRCLSEIKKVKRGTIDAYRNYLQVLDTAHQHLRATGKCCPVFLTPQLIGLEGKRVQVVDSFDEKRRFIVGKSTGWAPCHLEIKRRNSLGGGAVFGTPFKSIQVIKGGR